MICVEDIENLQTDIIEVFDWALENNMFNSDKSQVQYLGVKKIKPFNKVQGTKQIYA